MIVRGYKSGTVLDYETTYNTLPEKKNGYRMPIVSNELKKDQTLIESDVISGTRNALQPALGRVAVSGDIVIPVDYEAVGYWLKGQFGAPQTTAGEGIYTHKFAVPEYQPSMVIQKGFPDASKYMIYTGCKINTAEWKFGDDSEMQVTLSILGADRTVADAEYNSAAVTAKYLPISQNHAYVKLGGTESKIVKSVNFKLDGSLDDSQYVVGGGGVRGDIPEGLMQATGTITAMFTDTSLMSLADAGTKTSLEIGFKMDDKHSLAFNFPEIQIEPHDASISGPSGVEVEIPFRAFWGSDSGNSLVQVTLVNDVEGY